eukprot:scaffold590_cov383-Prasinococcus_capsulatus_cf.AAC.3
MQTPSTPLHYHVLDIRRGLVARLLPLRVSRGFSPDGRLAHGFPQPGTRYNQTLNNTVSTPRDETFQETPRALSLSEDTRATAVSPCRGPARGRLAMVAATTEVLCARSPTPPQSPANGCPARATSERAARRGAAAVERGRSRSGTDTELTDSGA